MPRSLRYNIQRRLQRRPRHNPVQQREAPKESARESNDAPSNALRQYQLRVNAPNDKYESEADTLAHRVTQTPAEELQQGRGAEEAHAPLAQQVTPLIQRQRAAKDDEETAQTKRIQRQETAKEEEEVPPTKDAQPQEAMKEDEEAAQTNAFQQQEVLEKEEEVAQAKAIQRQEAMPEEEAVQMSGKGAAITPQMEERITELQQSGRPLDASERAFYEPRFGADFSGVRVHDDAESAQIAAALNAHAFTQGQHIFFGSGQHSSGDTPGRDLMAHELTHTLQQGDQENNQQHSTNQRQDGVQGSRGHTLPVRDKEEQSFDISLDNVQFTAPSNT